MTLDHGIVVRIWLKRNRGINSDQSITMLFIVMSCFFHTIKWTSISSPWILEKSDEY